MRRIYDVFLLLFAFSTLSLAGQKGAPDQIDNFFKALISGKNNMADFVLGSELEKSQRLGISYAGVPDKFLISYDIDKDVKDKINSGDLKYDVKKESLGKGFTKATFSLKGMSYKREFFFLNNRFISPSLYYTQSWKNFKTKYFNLYLSDTSLFNNYSAQKLDQFVDALGSLLNLNKDDKELLEKNKIIYILCRDEKEIEKLTGFNTRGMYTLAFDEVITTFNCHFHEISHLLMNFRLRTLPLFTLPFFQEGFASATGGRGGLMRNIILDAGYYLQKAGYIPYNSILTKKEFASEDASMTYPVSGLYNLFLMNAMGIEAYLKLYRGYSGSDEYVKSLQTDSIKLPPQTRFREFLNSYNSLSGISFEEKGTPGRLIYEGSAGKIYDSGKFYLIRLRSNMILSDPEKSGSYKSKKFEEIFPKTAYTGAKYLVTSSEREVSVYNLYTNNLIASYSQGFSFSQRNVPRVQGGMYQFYISKDIFDEDLEFLQISGI
ncbi:MAG TPA: hypothetical protein VHO03_16180 [Ignavibacteriales bacterium]|nr:hypothetical protein [Ignavibacteriales bacterium]